MDMEKIAILADSGSDISPELAREMGIHVLPLKILYGEKEYADGENIDPSEVYARFPEEIPKTSTPNFAEIASAAQALRDEGYTHLLAVCISSGLSGTYQNMCAALAEVEGIACRAVDTRNISIGAGVLALYAARLAREGMPFAEICRRVEANVGNSKVFYYMDTLDYLRAGGRIGRVTGALGSLLDLKPIISCNDQGVYYTAAMIRGRRRGIRKLIDCVAQRVDENREALLAVMHGSAPEALETVVAELKKRIPAGKIFMKKQINASLAVHTGPGLVGILLFQPA